MIGRFTQAQIVHLVVVSLIGSREKTNSAQKPPLQNFSFCINAILTSADRIAKKDFRMIIKALLKKHTKSKNCQLKILATST